VLVGPKTGRTKWRQWTTQRADCAEQSMSAPGIGLVMCQTLAHSLRQMVFLLANFHDSPHFGGSFPPWLNWQHQSPSTFSATFISLSLRPSCSKEMQSDFGFLTGSNLENGLFKRKKSSEIGLDHVIWIKSFVCVVQNYLVRLEHLWSQKSRLSCYNVS